MLLKSSKLRHVVRYNLATNRNSFYLNSNLSSQRSSFHTNFCTLDTNSDQDTKATDEKIPKSVVFEVSTENWNDRVINDSQYFPVIVECCGDGGSEDDVKARNELHSKLVKFVKQQNSELTLGRLDVFEHNALAQDLGVQQIPTVMIIFQGNIIDQFIGIPDEGHLKTFIEVGMRAKYYREIEKIQTEGDEHLKQGNLAEARKSYSDLLYTDKYKSQAIGLTGLASCSLKEGKVSDAVQAMDIIKKSYPQYLTHPSIKMALSQIELLQQNVSDVDSSELLEKIKLDPKDLQSRYDLAVQYIQRGNTKLGFEQLFEMIKIDREWNEQAAKVLMLKTFASMEDNDELSKVKKKLNNTWYR